VHIVSGVDDLTGQAIFKKMAEYAGLEKGLMEAVNPETIKTTDELFPMCSAMMNREFLLPIYLMARYEVANAIDGVGAKPEDTEKKQEWCFDLNASRSLIGACAAAYAREEKEAIINKLDSIEKEAVIDTGAALIELIKMTPNIKALVDGLTTAPNSAGGTAAGKTKTESTAGVASLYNGAVESLAIISSWREKFRQRYDVFEEIYAKLGTKTPAGKTKQFLGFLDEKENAIKAEARKKINAIRDRGDWQTTYKIEFNRRIAKLPVRAELWDASKPRPYRRQDNIDYKDRKRIAEEVEAFMAEKTGTDKIEQERDQQVNMLKYIRNCIDDDVTKTLGTTR
jgi:hypothetical protein